MITFNYECDFKLENESAYSAWIEKLIASENLNVGTINYIFCGDEYLHQINVQYLDHDTLTDIISFDYREGDSISGDMFISIERVRDNASDYEVLFMDELRRVMAHGVLHYCGYKDKTDRDEMIMREKENEKMSMFHVEQ
ncbi:rRNA maturation RNase YbeY [Flavobacterium sp. NKUCC04_CG]|uniref:rRNA maturation RNase YbeY n=1 Tax=Flavobacterium sp. NKUCC04_CG TaxID=2842121 RepID=UPI001C5B8BB4|nr:rRNA maturation RNase YbeY [Flavobacterium sp. NKUCC04_CG]MBW3518852.1 rRNA maturation RNase YbeY [Flavobacterium sp. NKUCC04_CG]